MLVAELVRYCQGHYSAEWINRTNSAGGGGDDTNCVPARTNPIINPHGVASGAAADRSPRCRCYISITRRVASSAAPLPVGSAIVSG